MPADPRAGAVYGRNAGAGLLAAVAPRLTQVFVRAGETGDLGLSHNTGPTGEARGSGQRAAELRAFHVVVHVVIRELLTARNSPTGIRETANRAQNTRNGLGGRDRPDFGTVRPRVQIPGPRPK